MGAFVLGILMGWLGAWLFYTFWLKAGKDNGDCSDLKAELELKNRQISSLQSQLSSNSESGVSKAEVKSISTSTTKKNVKSSTKPSNDNTGENTKGKSKTAVSKKKTKASAPKTTTAKKTPVAKKPVAKPPTKPTLEKTAITKTVAKAKPGGDDFTKLSGIGPSMSATLKTLGIDTFKKLAETDDDILRDMLEASGARMNNNKEAMDSWNEQATVAASGDFKALKAMQVALKR